MNPTPNQPPYTAQQERLAAYAKALSHPARVFILQYLEQCNGCFVGSLASVLPMANSSLSQHLTALKEVGLIEGEAMPPRIRYKVHSQNWAEARSLFGSLFANEVVL
ncbi:MAG: winged helix-turn-helix transcriptional regulator [Bacteroidetes bacterium]|nr:winged helix-turn-helix transcriptional regulator [Bacteroidota bacterium]